MTIGTYDVRGSGRSWAVFDGGKQISRHYTCNYRAMEIANQLEAKANHRRRPCLRCGETMTSTHPGHRMCNSCRQLDTGMA